MAKGDPAGGGVAVKEGAMTNGAGGHLVSTGQLTEKQEAFCIAYCNNGENAGDAAREAGYSNPAQAGWRLMQNDNIVTHIDRMQRRSAPRLKGVAVRILERVGLDRATPPDAAIRAAVELERIGDKWSGGQSGGDKADGRSGKGGGMLSPNVLQILSLHAPGIADMLRPTAFPDVSAAQPIEIIGE